jgi:hypothetical protein
MADTGAGASASRAGHVRWRRRLLFVAAGVLFLLVSLHKFGARDTGMGTAVLGGLALIGFVLFRLPHLRRHFSRNGGGGRGPGSLNFPSQVAARQRAKRFRLFRRGGAGSGGGPRTPGGGRRSGGGLRGPGLPKMFRGRRRSGTGAAFGSAGASRSHSRHSAGSSRRRGGSLFRGGRGGAGIFRRGHGRSAPAGGTGSRRRASGGTGARRGHLPVWRRRGAAAGGGGTGRRRGMTRTGWGPARRRRPAAAGGGGTRRRTAGGTGGTGARRRRWFAPWRRRPARGSTSTGGGSGRRTARGTRRGAGRPAGGGPGPRRGSGSGGQPSWRRPVARARWRRANPLNPGHRPWYAPWRRAGGNGGPARPPGRVRRGWHRMAGTPAQRHTRHLARVSRRGRVRAARRRARANPYAGTGRWAAMRGHRRWWRRQHPVGWRTRIARRWRARRGLHRGLGIARPGRVRTRRPPRPLLAGARNSPGLNRIRHTWLGRGLAGIDRRRQDRWLRRQRRHAPAGVARPRAPQPVVIRTADGAGTSWPPAPQGARRAGTSAMANRIREMAGQDLTDPQDVHDSLTGMHELIAALHENLDRWGGQLESSGMHPAYAAALQRAAGSMAGVADRLAEVTAGGVMHGPGS